MIRVFPVLMKLSLIAVVFCNTCLGRDDLEVKEFLKSCYVLPYNPEAEMTDVYLTDAFYTDQPQIDTMANEVLNKYRSESYGGGNDLLKDLFSTPLMNKNANIQVFRERATKAFYCLSEDTNRQSFVSLGWEGGQFTNKQQFHMVKLSIPPHGTNTLWTMYAMQPLANRVTVMQGAHPLLGNEGFFIQLYGLPPFIRLNALRQTADPKSLPEQHVAGDPTWFSSFKISDKRLDEALAGKGQWGNWVSGSALGKTNLKEITFVDTNQIGQDWIRIVYNGSNPSEKYLAYCRDPRTSKIFGLYAWDYDDKGKPIRFLKIENNPKGTLRAWAQNIVYVGKSTNIDTALLNVDLTKFEEFYDQRPEFPVEYVNGKVVFDAKKDKYATVVGRSRAEVSLLNQRTAIRLIVLIVLLTPPLVMIFLEGRKRYAR